MNFWKPCLAKFDTSTKLATKKLEDEIGNILIGVHCLKILKIHYKLERKVPLKSVSLCCNLLTDYTLDANGVRKKVFTPLDIIIISGDINQEKVVEVTYKDWIEIADQSHALFWLQCLETREHFKPLTLNILFSLKKK